MKKLLYDFNSTERVEKLLVLTQVPRQKWLGYNTGCQIKACIFYLTDFQLFSYSCIDRLGRYKLCFKNIDTIRYRFLLTEFGIINTVKGLF